MRSLAVVAAERSLVHVLVHQVILVLRHDLRTKAAVVHKAVEEWVPVGRVTLTDVLDELLDCGLVAVTRKTQQL